MPLQLTRQQQLLRESMRREHPARSARTALRPLSLPRRGRKRSGMSGSRTVMSPNAALYTFVLMLDMVREAWEDQSRHRQDV